MKSKDAEEMIFVAKWNIFFSKTSQLKLLDIVYWVTKTLGAERKHFAQLPLLLPQSIPWAAIRRRTPVVPGFLPKAETPDRAWREQFWKRNEKKRKNGEQVKWV